MTISRALKQRFCKDIGITVKVYDEPYFSDALKLYDKQFDTLAKYDEFVKLVEELGGEQNYFAAYVALKESAMQYLRDNEYMQYFTQTEDMSKFVVKNTGFCSKHIYKDENVGRSFLSIDMKKGNFTSLRAYDARIVDNCKTYEDFLGKFTPYDYFKKSKYIRQVIFGNINPRRQITYEKYLMDGVLTELLKFTAESDIVYFGQDEIVIDVSMYTLKNFDSYYYKVKQVVFEQAERGVDLRVELFELGKIEGTQGYIKKLRISDSNKEYELKCVNTFSMPFVLRYLNKEEVQESDLMFEYEGHLAKIFAFSDINISYMPIR